MNIYHWRAIASLYAISMLISYAGFAQAPANYYLSADSLMGNTLRLALRDIIKNENTYNQSNNYHDLWTGYKTTDKKVNGKLWDMYSDVPNGTPLYEFTLGTDQCGNYNSEGDCYNREHTWPRSQFGGESKDPNDDIIMVIPTDGYVNGKRGNYSYGEVGIVNWESDNGSKLGNSSFPGFGGTVFEPIDEYKGDIARIMFYVATRYYQLDASFTNWEMANKTEFKPWALAMFLKWHEQDPVSPKELARNNAVYDFQNNRNPFVDHPEYVPCIWDIENCPIKKDGEPNDTTGISKITWQPQINLYPNPASNYINVIIKELPENESLLLQVYNLHGQQLLMSQTAANVNSTQLNIDNLSPGMYVLRVQQGTNIAHRKFVKQ